MKGQILLLVILMKLFILNGYSQPTLKNNYVNLFQDLGHSQEDIHEKIASTFEQLFYGDPDNEAVYFSAGKNHYGDLAYILDIHNKDIRSEGMSYGMMIAVQLNKKDIFDALWNYAKCHMYHADTAHPAYGYFGWSLNPDGSFRDEMPAPDGEEYFATALYFAASRWGNGAGIFNYKKEADRLVTDMIARKSIKGTAGGREVTGLSLFDLEHKMVRFTTDSTHAYHTDASYHLPAFYEVWALVGPPDYSSFWQEAAQVSRAYFELAADSLTGLTPDYGNFDGTPWSANWKPGSSTFSYDAWRTAMNWSIDWHWWQKDQRAVERSNRILSFFRNQGLQNYVNEYTLAGKKLSNNNSVGLIACNATVALAADTESKLDFVNALWQSEVPTGQYRYYDGLLMMLALLHCSGEFKIYM